MAPLLRATPFVRFHPDPALSRWILLIEATRLRRLIKQELVDSLNEFLWSLPAWRRLVDRSTLVEDYVWLPLVEAATKVGGVTLEVEVTREFMLVHAPELVRQFDTGTS